MNGGDPIGLDSNCYTFLIDAMASPSEPKDALAGQRVALFRVFLYRSGGLFLTPTVRKEFEAIRSPERAEHHQSWTTLFPETQPVDQAAIDARTIVLGRFHGDPGDCRIVAEAEDARLKGVLTFDSAFIDHLTSQTAVKLQRPLEFWNSLSIAKGATPTTVPRDDNPLSQETWWRWV
jgi:hypothetical protein